MLDMFSLIKVNDWLELKSRKLLSS